MNRTFGKRIWSMLLVICLMLSLFPTFASHVEVEVEAAISGLDTLTCAGFISNTTRQTYIDTMMRYYINNYSSLSGALSAGKSVVFMFEGGSDYYDSYPYVDGSGQTRLQAVCIVVQLNSSGNAYIPFYSEKCCSIPDNANYVTPGYETSGSTTILDGIYKMTTVNHNGNYAAHTTNCYTGWYTPYSGSTGYSYSCNGINIHTRSVNYALSGGGNSMGCQLIGYGASSSNEYNTFMKTVTGCSFNAYDGTQRTFSSTGSYTGYYVVDRQLGLMSPDGTEYGSGSLTALYTEGDLDGITAFSTSARANADFGYLSSCTQYPAHCEIQVTMDDTVINSLPRSVSTEDGSETLEVANTGAKYTATALYQNSYGNYWYQVTTSSGETGYIYGGECEYVKQLTSDITISNYDTPDGHVAGEIFYVTGDIKSTANKITDAAVWIYEGFGTSGSTVTGYSDTVNGYSYSLLNSTIDYNTSFGDVGTGNHTYAISANYINYYADGATTLKSNTGTISLVEDYFVVVSSAVDQSTCSHSYTTTTVGGSTCTDTVTTVKSCATCGYVTTSTAAGSHSYGSWTTTSSTTCTTDGSKRRTCSVCGYVETQTITAPGHSYSLTTHAATCGEYEKYEFTCSVCGDNYILTANELASGWIDYLPAGMSASLFNSKTQYRYSDYQTVTSYETSMSGYTLKSSQWVQSGSGTVNYVSSWPSGFSTSNSLYTKYNNKSNKITATETATTKTTVNSDAIAGYLYYHWCYSGSVYSTATQSGSYTTFHAYYDTTNPSNYTCDTSDMSYKTSHSTCSNSNWWFVAEVYAQNYTTYNKQFTYERWTDFSAWSDTAVTASTTRKVETRTVYQLKTATLGSHVWSGGACTVCGETCDHSYSNGTCTLCGKVCSHSYSNGICSICKQSCSHSYSEGTCTSCGIICTHNYSNGTCTVCGMLEKVDEYYLFGFINGVNYGCEENYQDLGEYKFVDGKLVATFDQNSYVAVKTGDNATWYMTNGWQGEGISSVRLFDTAIVGASGDKLYVPMGREITFTLVDNGDGTLTLSYVAAACPHTAHDSNGDCENCGEFVGHSFVDGICTLCGGVCQHNFVNDVCSLCGTIYQDYYLFGYINGANYGCEEDYSNRGDYLFEEGKLVATFDSDSYVAVKTADNNTWYMTDGWQGFDATSVTLYNTATSTIIADKLYVPGGVEITFTLVENDDGTLTLSYEIAEQEEIVPPTITLSYPTLSFEDQIQYNVYFTLSDLTNVAEMGLITFGSKLESGTIADAVDVISGYTTSGSNYVVHSNGIPAKMLGDALYFKVFARLTDGSYIYTDIAGYNAVAYAKTVLGSSTTSMDAKRLMVAMLNYGAEAQVNFNYKTDSLMNSFLTTAAQNLVSAYDETLVDDVVAADDARAGHFVMQSGSFTSIYPTVSFEGAFSVNYYFTNGLTCDNGLTFVYWDSDTYNSVTKLTTANATGMMKMTQDGNAWTAAVDGIAAKDIDKTIYVVAIYQSGGTVYTSKVIAYSIGKYCEGIAANGNSFGAATAVYGYYAKTYFANL